MKNSRGEYAEPLVKDTPYRAGYVEGIERFLAAEKTAAQEQSDRWITRRFLLTGEERRRFHIQIIIK